MKTDQVTGLSSGKLVKLKGRENYTSWAQQVQYHLREFRAWDIVRGKELEPIFVDAESSSETAKNVANDEAGTTRRRYSDLDKFEDKQADWDSRASRAARVILTTVTPEINQELNSIDGATAMWIHLKKYEGSGPAQRMEAYSHWRSLEYDGKDQGDRPTNKHV